MPWRTVMWFAIALAELGVLAAAFAFGVVWVRRVFDRADRASPPGSHVWGYASIAALMAGMVALSLASLLVLGWLSSPFV